jgi:dsDNA-specific endonuclease/ATPase MutS2
MDCHYRLDETIKWNDVGGKGMSFRKEVRETLARVEKKMDQLINLYGTMEGLKSQNEALFDKLMARDWEEYSSSPSMANREVVVEKKEFPLSPAFAESSIGEVLTDEDIGK